MAELDQRIVAGRSAASRATSLSIPTIRARVKPKTTFWIGSPKRAPPVTAPPPTDTPAPAATEGPTPTPILGPPDTLVAAGDKNLNLQDLVFVQP